MPDQYVEAGKVDEAEEILDVMFPSGDKAAEVVQPCKEPLDSPAPAVAAQFAAILTPAPIAPVGRDHLDPLFLMEPAIERVRVVGLVTDEPDGEIVEETSGQEDPRS
jgi:hypothetical protein